METNRLLLRKITKDDYDDIYEYSKEPNVGPNAGWKPHDSIEETIEIVNTLFLEKDTVWGIVLKENNKLIGTIGLMNDPKRENDKSMMIGYAMSEEYWSKGIMTEAVKEVLNFASNELKLDLVSAYCYPFNIRSKRVLEKNGFKYEGCLKQAEKIFNGQIYDNECYAFYFN